MTDKDIMEKLQAPFRKDEIEWRVGSRNQEKTKGLALAYITNRAIQNRLDEIFGCFGWRNEFKEWKQNSQLCGISVLHEGQWITKWDGAADSEMDATKGGLSDAMKRAAYQWGMGRYLYNLPSVWVALKNEKYLAEIPEIPDEFLPENERGQKSKARTTEPNSNNSENSNHEVSQVISEAQAKRLFAISKGNDSLIKTVLSHYGYTTLRDIKRAYYNKICEAVQTAVV